MNMINVKGTKNALPESDASQRYVQKSGDEVSRAPLVIGGLLAGVAAYLGSIFSWGREPQPPPQTKSGDTAAELLQAAKPAATAAEIETPAEVDQRASLRAGLRTTCRVPKASAPECLQSTMLRDRCRFVIRATAETCRS
ncbi:hypothetical protein HSBAA_21910 [Vreelandella sulfidaeris]|uniref:Uncharacterized protein n=1 Tax=Vreelandella sulfidaeris TaxID=115553 RepID=A0A455U4M8_9GAMM|nr:hypothetical protein HSBAA_21910 [Halomonas sulfidaeris]